MRGTYCAAHKGHCPRPWVVHVVLQSGRYAGLGFNLCARHWRRYESHMLAFGYKVVDRAR